MEYEHKELRRIEIHSEIDGNYGWQSISGNIISWLPVDEPKWQKKMHISYDTGTKNSGKLNVLIFLTEDSFISSKIYIFHLTKLIIPSVIGQLRFVANFMLWQAHVLTSNRTTISTHLSYFLGNFALGLLQQRITEFFQEFLHQIEQLANGQILFGPSELNEMTLWCVLAMLWPRVIGALPAIQQFATEETANGVPVLVHVTAPIETGFSHLQEIRICFDITSYTKSHE